MSFWENFTNFAPRNAVKLRLIALQFAANGLTISVVFSPKSCAFVIRLVVRDVVLGMGKNSILLTKQIFIFNLVLMSLRKLLLLIVASLVTFAINAQVTASGTVYDENNDNEGWSGTAPGIDAANNHTAHTFLYNKIGARWSLAVM